MEINLKNIENLIFYDKKVQELFPQFRHLFDQWQLGQRIPGMRQLGQRSVLEFLHSLDETNIHKLQEYFSENISVDKIDYKLCDNFNTTISDTEKLCEFSNYREFCITRNKENVSFTFCR